MKRRIFSGFTAIAAVAVGLAIVSAVLWQRSQPARLLEKAVPVAGEFLFGEMDARYFWVTPDEFLATREIAQGDYELVRIRAGTGAASPVRGVANLFAGHEKQSDVFSWISAPDGSEVLVTAGAPGQILQTAAAIDGSRTRSWAMPGWDSAAGEAFWDPKRRGWGQLERAEGRVELRFYGINSAADGAWRLTLAQHGSLVGISQYGWLIEADSTHEIRRFVRATWRAGKMEEETYRVTLPRRTRVVERVLSPDGQALAWILNERRWIPRWRWQGRFPFLQAIPKREGGLWTSTVGGEKWRQVARVKDLDIISGLEWRPDGRRLSFRCGNRLWTVGLE